MFFVFAMIGPTGFITKEIIQKHVAPASLKEKVKVFVCGALISAMLLFQFLDLVIPYFPIIGPPPQVASIAGKKAGMKQGELGGILKELGYTEDQV
jgi:cytochrome-b5 reductase